MNRVILFTCTLFCGTAASADEPKPKPEPPAEPRRAEGVLWCRNLDFAEPDLVAGKKVVVAPYNAPLTGVSLYVEEVGAFDIYLPDDGLKKLAKELQGRRVIVTGELRRLVVVTKWFGKDKYGTDVPAGDGRSVWVPRALAEPLPVIRTVMWASSLKPIGPKVEPYAGAPMVTRGDDKLVTFKRLPKSAEVVAVKLSSFSNAKLPDLKPLTIGNFPALLDGMRPVPADDKGIELEARAGWYDCKMQTVDGDFYFRLYLGGRGMLRAPDDSVGWVEFEHPK